jgi:glutamate N-acetyltransferase/amino-acid N-acetyltransferase
MPPRSPLAPGATPTLPPIAGVRLAARACGVRYKDRTDVCLMAFEPGTTVAGVFTRSLTASAPVERCRKHLKGGKARAILVNSGNANAFTGKVGTASVDRTVKAAASQLGFVPGVRGSTGVMARRCPTPASRTRWRSLPRISHPMHGPRPRRRS